MEFDDDEFDWDNFDPEDYFTEEEMKHLETEFYNWTAGWVDATRSFLRIVVLATKKSPLRAERSCRRRKLGCK
jgi:hypothetical protein